MTAGLNHLTSSLLTIAIWYVIMKIQNMLFGEVANMADKMIITNVGNQIALNRKTWKGKTAYISNYPGLLDAVCRYTWTYTSDKHPYLRSSVLGITLYKFVLEFLYGKENLKTMLSNSNIIEHLDNDGFNCTYENLHIISEDWNKAKAFSLDKMNAEAKADEKLHIPSLISDVYYSHENKYFQLQIFFNKNLVRNEETQQIVESFIFQYSDFKSLFRDWMYCYKCRKTELFDVTKFDPINSYVRYANLVELTDEEKDATFVQRDGKLSLILRTDPTKENIAFMSHIPFQDLSENNENK